MCVAPKTGSNFLGTAAEAGVFDKLLKTAFQFVAITASLLNTELCDGVIGYLGNIDSGK